MDQRCSLRSKPVSIRAFPKTFAKFKRVCSTLFRLRLTDELRQIGKPGRRLRQSLTALWAQTDRKAGMAQHGSTFAAPLPSGTGEPAKAPTCCTDSVLSERARDLLLTIQREGAFTSDARLKTVTLAIMAEGPKTDRQQFTRAVSELRNLGLVDTRVGRDGGVWLTVAGARRAKNL